MKRESSRQSKKKTSLSVFFIKFKDLPQNEDPSQSDFDIHDKISEDLRNDMTFIETEEIESYDITTVKIYYYGSGKGNDQRGSERAFYLSAQSYKRHKRIRKRNGNKDIPSHKQRHHNY